MFSITRSPSPTTRKPCTTPTGAATKRARAGANRLAFDLELGLALEDVEGVDVVCVGVRVDALEVRAEAEQERLQLGQLGEDAVPANTLPLAGADDDSVRHEP
jgi:hypothetical protein